MISNLLRIVSAGIGRGKLLCEVILFLTELTIFHEIHKYSNTIVHHDSLEISSVTVLRGIITAICTVIHVNHVNPS